MTSRALTVMYSALGSELGAVIDPGARSIDDVRQEFYRARARAGDAALARLQLRVFDGKLFLIHGVELPRKMTAKVGVDI